MAEETPDGRSLLQHKLDRWRRWKQGNPAALLPAAPALRELWRMYTERNPKLCDHQGQSTRQNGPGHYAGNRSLNIFNCNNHTLLALVNTISLNAS